MQLFLSVLGNSGTGSLFEYDGTVVSGVSQTPGDGPAAGAGHLNISGYFGKLRSVSFLVGDTPCTSSEWVSETSYACQLAPGTGGGLKVSFRLPSISGGFRVFPTPLSFSYDAPVVTSLVPGNAPTASGALVTVYGYNFGASCADPPSCSGRQASVGASACTNSTWTSDSAIVCLVRPGYGAELPVVAHIDSQASSGSGAGASFSYDAGVVTAVRPESVPAYGGVDLTIFGASLAPAAPTQGDLAVRVGESAAAPTPGH
jgi:hypothetical protein